MDHTVIVNEYRQMDRIVREQSKYLLDLVKRIKKAGCNVLLIQKSILRDAVTDLSLSFLAKLKIGVVKEVERDEIEFLSKSLGCKPIADIDGFTEDKMGYAELVDEVEVQGVKVIKISGVRNPGRTVSVLCMGSNSLVLEETERSLHDALCVVRCLVKKRCVVAFASPRDQLTITLPIQGADRRWWRTRDPRLTHALTPCADAQGYGSVLLPGVRRRA